MAQGSTSTGISSGSVHLKGARYNDDIGPRARLWPLAYAVSRPDRVLARRLPADCYASYSVQLSAAEISASQARSRMHCHDGMHLLKQGSDLPEERSHAALSRANTISRAIQSIIGYVKPTIRPPPSA